MDSWKKPGFGISRRDFMRICSAAAAAIGLPVTAAEAFFKTVQLKSRPSVIWLHFQECTGCTETLLRASYPSIQTLLLKLISLDYHETLLTAAGHQAEKSLRDAMLRYEGQYICIVEGAIPTKDGGVYCKIAGRTALDMLRDVGGKAGVIIAVGSCASFGGLPAAKPNPTGAKGVPDILKNKPVVTIPGCPPHPYNLLGTVLHYLTYGKLPALDTKNRPLFAYGRSIHEHCPRRPHFDAGRFAECYGDDAHRLGHCLYKLGCKGPETFSSCPTQHFCDVSGVWPVGIGHPCLGCTEQALAFRKPLHELATIPEPTPPCQTPSITAEADGIDPIATGVAGLLVGGVISAGVALSRRFDKEDREEP